MAKPTPEGNVIADLTAIGMDVVTKDTRLIMFEFATAASQVFQPPTACHIVAITGTSTQWSVRIIDPTDQSDPTIPNAATNQVRNDPGFVYGTSLTATFFTAAQVKMNHPVPAGKLIKVKTTATTCILFMWITLD
jgi:hypothetical protein